MYNTRLCLFKFFLCKTNEIFAFFFKTRLATLIYNCEFFFTCLKKNLIAEL